MKNTRQQLTSVFLNTVYLLSNYGTRTSRKTTGERQGVGVITSGIKTIETERPSNQSARERPCNRVERVSYYGAGAKHNYAICRNWTREADKGNSTESKRTNNRTTQNNFILHNKISELINRTRALYHQLSTCPVYLTL